MEQKKTDVKKLGLVLGAVGVVVVLAVVLIFTLGKKKEAYRNIRVSEVTGEVIVNREGMEGLEAYANMNLMSGDEIVTEKGARVTLRLDEDKYVILDEESKITLHATGSAENSKTTLQLEYGAVFSDIKNKLSEDSGYEVTTPASTMSVRGTQFEVVYREKRAKVLTYDGAVYVAVEGAAEGRTVNAGELDVIVENEDGGYKFEGETKKIEAEDVGAFVTEYLKESGIEFEAEAEPMLSPEPTQEATLTEAPVEPTKVPDLTATPEPTHAPEPTVEPTPSPEPTATPVPTVTPVLMATATPAPTEAPVPTETPMSGLFTEPAAGEAAIRYHIVAPPRNLLPEQNTYTVTYSGTSIVISDGEYSDTYGADTEPYAMDAATLEEDISPHVVGATENYLPVVLAGRLAEYGADVTVNCFGWYDATKTMWFDWIKFLRDATLVDNGLNLYPAYTVQVPYQGEGTYPYNISCVPVLITVEETGQLFCLSLPEGSNLKCVSQNGNAPKWKQNGAETDLVTVQYSTLSQFRLSVGN